MIATSSTPDSQTAAVSDDLHYASIAGVSRFRLEEHSVRILKNKRIRIWFAVGGGCVLSTIWLVQVAYLGLPHLPGGFLDTGYLLGLAALFLAVATVVGLAPHPVELVVRPDAIAFRFSNGKTKSIPWSNGAFSVELWDERGASTSEWFSELSPYAGWFGGLPATSSVLALPPASFAAILDMARNRGLSVDARDSQGGRHRPPAGTHIYWIHQPGT